MLVYHEADFKATWYKKSLILTWIERFRTVTPIWIHPWLWNDAQGLTKYGRGALSFSNVIHQISRSHKTKESPILTQIEHFWTVTSVWIHPLLRYAAQSLMQYKRMPYCFFCQSSNFKVAQNKKSLIVTWIERFWTVTPVWIHQWIWNDAQSLM